MKLRSLAMAGVAAIVGLAGAACADDATPAPTAPQATTAVDDSDTPDPCLLLTAQDFTAVTGIPFHQIEVPESDFMPETPGYRSCNYEETGDRNDWPSAAWIALYPTDRAEFDSGRDMLMDLHDDQEVIDGIGEAAYGNSEEIRFFHDGWYIEIAMMWIDLDGVEFDGTDVIEGLAKTAISRLP